MLRFSLSTYTSVISYFKSTSGSFSANSIYLVTKDVVYSSIFCINIVNLHPVMLELQACYPDQFESSLRLGLCFFFVSEPSHEYDMLFRDLTLSVQHNDRS